MKTGQKNINGNWYMFDDKGVMKVGFVTIPSQNKTVYYSEDKAKLGQMQYGKTEIKGKTYYFDTFDGAMKTGVFYNKETGTLQYYGNNGQMNYGNVVINGKVYTFDAAGNYLGKGNVTIDGHDYYLGNNNQVLVGFQKISNNTYYYNKDKGQKEYGQKNIDGSWYMFDDKTGVMKTGFVTIPSQNKTVYYGNNGQMQYGQRNIDGHWYMFDTYNGAMKTGLVYIPEQNKTVYYGSNGQMQYGVFRVGKITYTADHISGAIIGVYNDAEVIGQNPELPTGCEITAVTMMLRYAGANINKIQLANEMPRSNNGDYGFVGNPFSVTGWWVFPTGVAPVVNKHLGHSQVMTGASLESIKNKLLNGHLVVAWVANMNGFVNHAIALTGYNGNTLYYNNPWTARKESMSVSSFYTHWNADKQRALSY